ncbi:MAG: DUF6027 family protein [Caldilineaceae bacterium]
MYLSTSPRRTKSIMNLQPYTDTWPADDPHANFKAEVALYTVADPLPTLENLSKATGIPVPALVRYVLVKYAASGADALLAMTPIAVQQMAEHVAKAEATATDTARLEAYQALRQMIAWLQLGAEQ